MESSIKTFKMSQLQAIIIDASNNVLTYGSSKNLNLHILSKTSKK